jgi:hypothetical protein
MNEYMMIFRNEKMEGAQAPSAEQMKAVMSQWQSWIKGIATKGKYSGTNRLLSEGKTLKPGNAVTDGPYAEVKEVVGGYLIVKASSLEDAVELAKSCPNLIYGGNVEVRSVMPINSDVNSDNFLEQKQ